MTEEQKLILDVAARVAAGMIVDCLEYESHLNGEGIACVSPVLRAPDEVTSDAIALAKELIRQVKL